jgi:hypothetical protein
VPLGENTRRGRAGEVNSKRLGGQTHCGKDHEFTSANTYIDSRGHRGCKKCRNARKRAQYKPRERCRYGHLYTEAAADGRKNRRCLICFPPSQERLAS